MADKNSAPRPTTLVEVNDNKLTKTKVDGNSQGGHPCPEMKP